MFFACFRFGKQLKQTFYLSILIDGISLTFLRHPGVLPVCSPLIKVAVGVVGVPHSAAHQAVASLISALSKLLRLAFSVLQAPLGQRKQSISVYTCVM